MAVSLTYDQLQSLDVTKATLECVPYYVPRADDGKPDGRLERAYQLVKEGAVQAGEGDSYNVQGSKQVYTVIPRFRCECARSMKGTNKWCAHLIAVELYDRWQKALQPGLFPASKTAEERLAGIPPATPLEAPGEPVEASKPQDVPEAILPPALPLEAPSTPEMPSLPRLDLQLPRRSISAIVADLSKPIPAQCWATIPASDRRPAQDFLHWHTVATILDTYAPGWEGEITRVEKIGERQVRVRGGDGKPAEKTVERVAVTYRLTIHAAEGAFCQEDAGMEDEDKDDYGDAMTSAIATAMKRAAAKFGVGRQQSYDKDKKSAAFLDYVRGEKQNALAELGKCLDEQSLPREATLAWLKAQTGAARNDQIPLWAIRAVMQQLSTAALAGA